MSWKTFPEALKKIMIEADFTQADLVKSGVISKSYLSELLSGKHPAPDVSRIKAICRELYVDRMTENKLMILAGKEIEHAIQNEAAANFLRKTVNNGWSDEDWDRHNKIIDAVEIGKKIK